ncbi:DUF547 domain-containing protein [Aquimarina sp. BL5]|uniref:DUF547 domain-containing protein n=1 Tax=Aquimarina sp. BL5 TaxID=1714860 RepID=UPI000E4F32E9|nr:DUF547 domain-containing protein [Aquimarina sp. BL5]AXT52453.1 DUF547 domain-containing protein [Aquimarina sp. BL5]RKN03297.1 DUF547 domain-containing protein [Aquimarina sp. BL5]
MKKIIFLLTFLTVTIGSAQNTADFFTKSDAFFKKHVTKGKVDYKSIKNDPTTLNELLDIAAGASVSKNDSKTFQAFFINGYNLSVIKGIVDNYPTKSPLDIKGFFDKTKYTLGGKTTTLNDLENKILRKNFPTEARFHFALVCAGLGCPPIISEAYTPSLLEKQLQRQTTIALNNPNFIKVKGKKVQLSKIFEWYKGDFTQNGSEIDYVNQFRKEKIPTNAKVSYYPYNWSLNSIK